ncbi:hypothetical protein FACS189418_1270 [Clostridia bacterium]|nr:hypothetical protein FACS189418_1270 [Clostridia bacterium]
MAKNKRKLKKPSILEEESKENQKTEDPIREESVKPIENLNRKDAINNQNLTEPPMPEMQEGPQASPLFTIKQYLNKKKEEWSAQEKKYYQDHTPCTREEFLTLLGAVASLMSKHSSFTTISVGEEATPDDIRQYLQTRFRVTDKNSFLRSVRVQLMDGAQSEYLQFLKLWNKTGTIKEEDMDEDSREVFAECQSFAEQFYPVIQEDGFYAWDLGETVERVRLAFSCGLIEESLADAILEDVGNRAIAGFKSWTNYAISYVCGGAYFMFRANDRNEEEGMRMLEQLMEKVPLLFSDSDLGYWAKYPWIYQQTLKSASVIELLPEEEKKQYEQALALYQQGQVSEDVNETIAFYEKAVEAMPASLQGDTEAVGEIIKALGKVYLNQQNYVQGLIQFTQQMRCHSAQNTEYALAALHAGICAYELGSEKDALHYFELAHSVSGNKIFHHQEEKYKLLWENSQKGQSEEQMQEKKSTQKRK